MTMKLVTAMAVKAWVCWPRGWPTVLAGAAAAVVSVARLLLLRMLLVELLDGKAPPVLQVLPSRWATRPLLLLGCAAVVRHIMLYPWLLLPPLLAAMSQRCLPGHLESCGGLPWHWRHGWQC